MFRIIKGETALTTVANPTWVTLQSNGCFALCSRETAQGVSVDGEVYHILGTADIEGKEDVAVAEIDDGTLINDLTAENKLLKAQVDALSETNDFQEELIIELADVVYA